MSTKWKLIVTKITIPSHDKSIIKNIEIEGDSIKAAQEKADEITKSLIAEEHPSLTSLGECKWVTDLEERFTQKYYDPLIAEYSLTGISIPHLPDYCARILPIGVPLLESTE